MTLAQLSLTVALLGCLGLVANRVGLSAIPAYLLAGLLLGPNEPKELSLIHPSEVTTFVADVGIVFLLFFLGLEFSLVRLLRSGRHVALGGGVDFLANAGLGAVLGIAAFGFHFAALALAAAFYVSSSAVAVKGLLDLRRLADPETALILAILIFEDLAIAFVLGLVGRGGGHLGATLVLVGKALGFIAVALAASRWLSRPLDTLLRRLPLEVFLLFVVAFVAGSAALAQNLGLSQAIGALMAGVVVAETSIRVEIEDRFASFRDLFAALFFFVFGLSIDVGALGRVGWLLAAAVALTLLGKIGGGYLAGRLRGFSRRPSLNVGVALVAHGEFTIVLAQLASGNAAIPAATRGDLVAFAGLYVLVTSTIGLALMKESNAIGQRLPA